MKEGAKLRFELMELEAPKDWFRKSLERYWGNRKLTVGDQDRKI